MNFKQDIYSEIVRLKQQRIPAVVVTIVEAKGSVPRHTGSKMIVLGDGAIIGTIGGAILEKQSIDIALEALKQGTPQKYRFQLHEKESAGSDSIATGMLCGGEVEVFVEPISITPAVHIFGAGHVAKPTAHLAAMCGFSVYVYDEREDMAAEERFPEAAGLKTGKLSSLLDTFKPAKNDFIVIVSPSHDIDYQVLRKVIDQECRYLGVICSRRKWKIFREKLIAEGIGEQLIDQVHAPIGIEIGSETPEEIAVSIVGEMIKVKNHE
ncbi:MAG: XdhC family protein [FCB group bacterium]|nr:XdhC family protein [FCB group bacterium]